MPNQESIERQFPVKYKLAGICSRKERNRYFLAKGLEYTAIAAAAFAAIFPTPLIMALISERISFQGFLCGVFGQETEFIASSGQNFPALLRGMAFLTAIFAIFIERILRKKEHWFNYRSLAEGIKAESWRFCMKTEPYDRQKDETFIETMRTLISEKIDSPISKLRKAKDQSSWVTPEMLKKRGESPKERGCEYLKYRLGDQKLWYEKKAWHTNRISLIFTFFVLAMLFLGVAISFIQFYQPWENLGIPGFIAALVGALSGWTQTKRYEWLALTYARSHEELEFLYQKYQQIFGVEGTIEEGDGEKELQSMVRETEAVISTEHRVWFHRK